MQSASAALMDAIEASEREPVCRVVIDWDGPGDFSFDVSDVVAGISVDSSLASELPDAVKVVTGYASATGQIELAGLHEDYPVVTLLSGLRSDGALVTRRLNVNVTIEYGMRGADGPEYLKALTGKVRAVDLDVAAGTATVEVIDLRTTLAGQVTLPVIAADDFDPTFLQAKKPGLDGQWVIDYVFRQCGYSASPPIRDQSCVLSATMHGSVWPERGELEYAYWFPLDLSAGLEPVRFTDGVFGEATLGGFIDTGTWTANSIRYAHDDTLLPGVVFTDDSAVFVEGWFFVGDSDDGDILKMYSGDEVSARLSFEFDASNPGTLRVIYSRDGSNWATIDGPTLSGDPAWHYLALSVTFDTTTTTVRFRVDDTTTEKTGTPAAGDGSDLIDATVLLDYACEALQVTTEAYDSSMFNDDYPNSMAYGGTVSKATLQTSRNPLTGVPLTSSAEAWSIVQAVAEAEQGMVGFDESGVPYFRNRQSLVSGTSSLTVSSLSNLTGLSSTESIDTVRNVIRVGAQPLRLDTAEGILWVCGEGLFVPPGSTVTVWAQFDAPVYSIDEEFDALATSGSPTGSGYRANTRPDGTGTNITSGISVVATKLTSSVKLDVTNNAGVGVYLVNPTATGNNAGQPSLRIYGKLLRATSSLDGGDAAASGYTVSATDTDSVTAYGEQVLDVTDNPWRQSLTSAESLAGALLLRLKDPKALLTNVPIVGDPRLQLGDRVTITEPDGLALDSDFVVVANSSQFDGGGLVQNLTVREATDAWILGDTTFSVLGSTTVLDA